jgi:drug/metabolite transporter (DMT)-like permease
MLNLEAVFTLALGRLLWREHSGRAVVAAATLVTVGGAFVVADRAGGGGSGAGVLGLLAVGMATLAWALDNALSKPLAQRDPRAVVRGKALLGVTLSTVVAWSDGEPRPEVGAAMGVFLCGALGYGTSLRFYLAAQRALGAGRTASVFATAPFVGAAVAWAMGDRSGGAGLAAGAVLMGVGVFLHATERHTHPHAHAALEHEHAHTHDDGHHDHAHDPMPLGPHSHAHRHEPLVHSHAHAPDVHHEHEHE